MLPYFHNFMLYHTFFLFRMLDGHLMHLMSWKKVLNMRFFLYTTFRICIPHISQWTKTWKNITDKYFSENDLIDVIYRFVSNNSILFIWENEKMKKLKISQPLHIANVSVPCYSVCTGICVFTLYMCKVLIKNIFGHGIKLHTAIYSFNIH